MNVHSPALWYTNANCNLQFIYLQHISRPRSAFCHCRNIQTSHVTIFPFRRAFSGHIQKSLPFSSTEQFIGHDSDEGFEALVLLASFFRVWLNILGLNPDISLQSSWTAAKPRPGEMCQVTHSHVASALNRRVSTHPREAQCPTEKSLWTAKTALYLEGRYSWTMTALYCLEVTHFALGNWLPMTFSFFPAAFPQPMPPLPHPGYPTLPRVNYTGIRYFCFFHYFVFPGAKMILQAEWLTWTDAKEGTCERYKTERKKKRRKR